MSATVRGLKMWTPDSSMEAKMTKIRSYSSVGSFSEEYWFKGGFGALGASVAKLLAHLPFTSETAGSSLSENFLNATRTQSSCEKSESQRSAESRGFPPGTPVSSHRESWQGGLGKKGPQ
jgi:hypothetical protein